MYNVLNQLTRLKNRYILIILDQILSKNRKSKVRKKRWLKIKFTFSLIGTLRTRKERKETKDVCACAVVCYRNINEGTNGIAGIVSRGIKQLGRFAIDGAYY